MKLLSSSVLRLGWLLLIPSTMIPFSSSQDLCNPTRPSVSLTLTFLDDSIMNAIDKDASEETKLAVNEKMNIVYPWLSSLMGNTCILQVFGFDESTFYHDNKKTSSIPGETVIEGEWQDAYERGIQLVGPSAEFHAGKGFEIETNCTESVEFFQYLFDEDVIGREGRRYFKILSRSDWKRNETDTWSLYDLMTITFLTTVDVTDPIGVGEWKLSDFSRTDLLAARIPSDLLDHYPSIEGLTSGRVDLKARPEAIEIDPGASVCSDKLDIPEPILPSTNLCTVNDPSLRLKIKFIDEPNDRTLSFRNGVDKTEVVDELSNTFLELFELFNKTCILELQNLNETNWSSVSMRQTKTDVAAFSRTLKQIHSHSPYDMTVTCDDGAGEEYFKSFVQRRLVVIPPEGDDVDYCNVLPQRPFSGPSHFSIDLGSTFSGVDLDTMEGGTYIRDGFTITFGLGMGAIVGVGSEIQDGCVYDYQAEDFLPDWIGGSCFYTFSSDRSSRDEDLKYYNAFPFGENNL